MKSSNLVLSAALALSTFATGSVAFAGAAANSQCESNKAGLAAEYQGSMFGETLTTVEANDKRITYFVDDLAKPAPGSKMLLQDDPNQDELQQLAGTYASELAEVVLSPKEQLKYDFGFLFQGVSFRCLRN